MGWTTRLGWFFCALVWCGTASGQGVDTTGASPSSEGEPDPVANDDEPDQTAEVDALPSTFVAGWRWSAVGPATRSEISDVAISSEDTRRVAAITREGEVWLSVDAAASWTLVLEVGRHGLGSGSSDESVLIGVEARVEELRGSLDVAELEVDPEDFVDDPDGLAAALEDMASAAEELADQAASATDEALDQVRGEVADGVFFEANRSTSWQDRRLDRATGMPARNRVWFGGADQLLAGRSDGLHLSSDLGQSWSRVLDVRVNALLQLPERGLWVAGTSDGMRFAVDFTQWIDAYDGTEGVQIWDLGIDSAGAYAASSSGLWFSPDAQVWGKVGTLEIPYRAMLLPDADGEVLLLASGRSVRRSADVGFSLLSEVGAPLLDVQALLRVASDHVLAATADGPWESVDGGETWSPLARGLSEPRIYGLAREGRDILMASEGGVFRLVAEAATTDEPSEGLQDHGMIEPWIPLNALVGSAISRRELTASVGSRIVAASLPEVTLQGALLPRDSLKYDPIGGSRREFGTVWTAGVILRWTPSRPTRQDVTPVVLGESVEVVASLSPATLGHAVRRSASTYAVSTAAMVSDLYTGRAELIAYRTFSAQEPLRDQVRRELKILELEAQLDHITNGAVSAWRSQ